MARTQTYQFIRPAVLAPVLTRHTTGLARAWSLTRRPQPAPLPHAAPPIPPIPPPPPPPVGINSLSAVLADMQTADEDTPHGVPTSYSWEAGPTDGVSTPGNPGSPWAGPCTAGTFWGQVYFGHAGPGADTNVRVQVRRFEFYVHSRSQNKWFVMQQCNSGSTMDGAQFVEDFVNNASVPANIRDEVNNGGGVSCKMTRATTTTVNGTEGYNFHFFARSRALIPITNTDVDAAFSTGQARLILDNAAGVDDRHLGNYVVNVGSDWWLDQSVGFGTGFNNPGVYESRFRKVPTDGTWVAVNAWSGPVGFHGTWLNAATYSGGLTAAQITAVPPPLNAMGP